MSAHRLSYELFVGPIPPGTDILHSCDDPGCVDPDHLHPGDDLLNTIEKIERGRVACNKGNKNGRAKLTKHRYMK